MNERTFRPANIAAGAAVIGGALIVVLPQHAISIAGLVIVTIAAAAGFHALAVNAPPAWWRSPFDASGRADRQDEADEIDRVRSRLHDRRQRIARDTAIPPGTIRLLQPLIQVALEREGIDTDDESAVASARALVSPLTWTVFTTAPLERQSWFSTVRPNAVHTADVMNRVLDDLDRLAGTRETSQQHVDRPAGTGRTTQQQPDPRDLRAT